jgi:hypothetical protein
MVIGSAALAEESRALQTPYGLLLQRLSPQRRFLRRQRKGSSALDQSEERPDERQGRGENDNILGEFEGLVGLGQDCGKIVAMQQSVHVCS